jgi:hypothetical protein
MRHSHHYGSCWEAGRWDHVGHAAERFARRVARDASKFAERVQEHAGDLAEDLVRERRRRHGEPEADSDRVERPDVRKIFEEVRAVVAGIADGVDELIDRIFPQETKPSAQEWTRVVTNRAGSCANCGTEIATGDECYVRGEAGARELRCLGCGGAEGQ